MIDECFYVNVQELMDRVEELQELEIIHVPAKDSDYYERSEFSGLYSVVQ